jgi:hypothetical protein
MIEIFGVFGAAIWFAREANAIGKSGVLWAFIALAGYYIPVLIFGNIIFPILISGSVTQSNITSFQILSIVLNILIGLTSLLLIRRRILKLSKKDDLERQEKLELKRSRRIPIASLNDLNSIKGKKCYKKDSGNFIGTIIEINFEDKKCRIKGDFNKESERPIDELLIDE